MKVLVVVLGLLAAVVAGAAVALLAGDTAGYVVAGLFVVAAVVALFAPRGALKGLLVIVLVGLVGGGAVVAWGGVTVFGAIQETDGPVEAADPADLAAADAKIDAAEGAAAFRLELSEEEMRAYALDALQDESDNPISDVRFDLQPGEAANGGELGFEAELKSGGSTAEGAVTATLENGAVEVEIIEVGLGAFQLPGLAETAIEDLVARIADFNEVLAERRADVQSITFTETTLIITGTQAGADVLTSESFLTGFADQAASAVEIATVPEERFGPGVVDGTSAGSAPFYVAIGDSLAANVGVESAVDGYVSRFHNQLQIADDRDYGLRNFGVSGETTGTMIRTGQLDAAVAFLEGTDAAYVTINVGANNLLGHLGTADCRESVDNPACRERVNDAFAAYPRDLETIFEAVAEAAPDATIIFMTAYNPFNLGFGTDLEAEMSRALTAFNALALRIADDFGLVIADGFGAMEGTAAVTTHMLDPVPDIHPNESGYDLLTGALVDSFG